MFARKKPLARFHRLVRLPGSDEDANKAIVRVPNGAVDSGGEYPYKFRRLQPVVITNVGNGKSILRFVHGAAWLKGITNDTLAVNYDGFRALGLQLDEGDQVELEMRPAKALEVWKFYYFHDDPVMRFSARVAIIGLLAGIAFGLLGIGVSILLVYVHP